MGILEKARMFGIVQTIKYTTTVLNYQQRQYLLWAALRGVLFL